MYVISCPKFFTLCYINLPIFFSDGKKSVSEILFDKTELTELKSQEWINTQITYYQASQDQRRGFSKNLSLGIRKNPQHRWKLNSHIVATYECHRCLAPSNGKLWRNSPFGQKKPRQNVARFCKSHLLMRRRSTSCSAAYNLENTGHL